MGRSSSVKSGAFGLLGLNGIIRFKGFLDHIQSEESFKCPLPSPHGCVYYIVKCRSHLSLEQFSAFLANIKEFNAQKQSREVIDKSHMFPYLHLYAFERICS